MIYFFLVFHLLIFISLYIIRVGALSVKFWFVEPEKKIITT